MEQAEKAVAAEARAICKDGILSKANKVIDEHFSLNYNLLSLTKYLKTLAPIFFNIIHAFSVTTRQKNQLTDKWHETKTMVRVKLLWHQLLLIALWFRWGTDGRLSCASTFTIQEPE